MQEAINATDKAHSMYRSRCEQFKKAREAVKRAEAALAAFNAGSSSTTTSGGGGGEKPQATVARSESSVGGPSLSMRATNRERRAAIPSSMNLSSISESFGGSSQGDAIERDPPSTASAAVPNADGTGSNGSAPKSDGSKSEGGSGLSYGSVFSQLQGLISGASTKPDVKLERRRKEEDEALHKACPNSLPVQSGGGGVPKILYGYILVQCSCLYTDCECCNLFLDGDDSWLIGMGQVGLPIFPLLL